MTVRRNIFVYDCWKRRCLTLSVGRIRSNLQTYKHVSALIVKITVKDIRDHQI